MKITDFALIFLGVILPIIIIVYINVSFTIKAIEEEMYYQKLIDSALADAAMKMKQVESDDPENDYGYSGIVDNRVSINANIAAETFISSLANNLEIKGNKSAQNYLKFFIPALAIIDYNGVYIYSIEDYQHINSSGVSENKIDHVMHPKRYFSYTYGIYNDKYISDPFEIQKYSDNRTNGFSVHTVEFSMDDYLVHRAVEYVGHSEVSTESKGFYLNDEENNSDLVAGSTNSSLKTIVIKSLASMRKTIIIDVITKELTTAVNKHNMYASVAGIKYTFSFPYITEDEMYRYVDDIGALALVQGISVGNKYLNYKSYGGAAIEATTKYYLTIPATNSKFNRNLYHKDDKCPEFGVSNNKELTPKFLYTKQQASSLKATVTKGSNNFPTEGFYPCPICRP